MKWVRKLVADPDAKTKAELEDENKRLKWRAANDAKARWEARRKAAMDALPLPENMHRIRRTENTWVCEKAKAALTTSGVQDTKGEYVVPSVGFSRWDYQLLNTPEEYDADTNFAAYVWWELIGPKEWCIYSSGAGATLGPSGYYKTLSFSTYDEAEKWLQRFLKPVEEIVYYDSDGKPVK